MTSQIRHGKPFSLLSIAYPACPSIVFSAFIVVFIMSTFDIQPIERFAGSSAAIRRPKVNDVPAEDMPRC